MKKILILLLLVNTVFAQKSLDSLFRAKDSQSKGLSKNDYSNNQKDSLNNKISHLANITKLETVNYSGMVNGATISSNVITIPIGSSGHSTYWGFSTVNSSDLYLMNKITVTMRVVITNYSQLSGGVALTPFTQKLKGTAFYGNLAPTSSTYIESISGSTMTRDYTITQNVNQDVINEGYYYNIILQLQNSGNNVTTAVTITATGNLTYETNSVQYISRLYTSSVSQNPSSGATTSNNVITIPIGQTGAGSYPVLSMTSSQNIEIGQQLTASMTLVITNYTQLSGSVAFNVLAQRYQKGAFITNITPTEVVVSNSISGSTLTRNYTVRQIVSQSDIDLGYYYNFAFSLSNSNAVTSAVTITSTGSITARNEIKKDIISSVDRLEKKVRGSYNAFTIITVGTSGYDFTDIQTAINSIGDASADNQYEIQVFNDFYYTARSSLKGGADNSTTMSYVFQTKDYVHIRGMGGQRKISVILPNNSSANNLIYTQVAFHSGSSRIENFNLIIKNGRYAVHTEGGGVTDADDLQELVNCKLEHLGNQDADNFASWKSDIAWGFGNSSGQKVIAKNCQFYARKQSITYHTNASYRNPTWLRLENCDLFERESSTLGTTSDPAISMNYAELGSSQQNNLEIVGSNFTNTLDLSSSWYLNTTNRNDARTQFPSVYGRGNAPFAVKFPVVNVLVLTAANFSQNITVKGGTAKSLIFGDEWVSKTGSSDYKAYCVGSIAIERTTNAYVTNYMSTLGHRLGNCSSVNKTLIVTVNGVDYTVTFNKDYSGGAVTSVPAYSYTQILAEINTALSGVAVATDTYTNYYINLVDTYITVKNSSTSASILQGMGVVFDYSKGVGFVRAATISDIFIDGIAVEDIQFSGQSGKPDDVGKILLKGKGMIEKWQNFRPYNYSVGFNSTDTIEGKMLKISGTGGFAETTSLSDAVLIGTNKEIWKFIDQAKSKVSVTGLFSDLVSKPTTLSGYGITDFNSTGDARYAQLGTANTMSGNLNVNAFGQFGTSTEKLSISGVDIGFNRNTQSGAIYNNTVTAYQWRHTSSTTLANDYLALQRYNSSGSFQNYPISFNGNGTVGINTVTQDASAQLEIASTTRGFLLPRMTSTQASAISSPVDGLLVYVTDTNGTFTSIGFWGRVSSTWQKLNN